MNSLKIALNVYRRLFKDISSIGFIFVFPIVAIFMAYFMFAPPATQKIGVMDGNYDTLGISQFLDNSDRYDIVSVNKDEVDGLLKDSKVLVVLEFDKDFMGNISQGILSTLPLVCKSEDQNVQKLRGSIEQYIGLKLAGKEINADEIIVSANPLEQARTAIGIFSMFMLIFAGVGMALLFEDKQKKTFMRIFSAPVKEFEVVAGNLLAFSLLGALQIAIFLTFFTIILKVTLPILSLFLILFIFYISAIGLAIAIAALMKDGSKFNMVISCISIVTSFLSGAFFSLKAMDMTMQRIANILPQKWLLDAFDALTNNDSSQNLLLPVSILLLFGVVFFSFGAKVLKPSAEDL